MCGGVLIFASYTSRAYFYTFRSVSLFRYVKIIINKKKRNEHIVGLESCLCAVSYCLCPNKPQRPLYSCDVLSSLAANISMSAVGYEKHGCIIQMGHAS